MKQLILLFVVLLLLASPVHAHHVCPDFEDRCGELDALGDTVCVTSETLNFDNPSGGGAYTWDPGINGSDQDIPCSTTYPSITSVHVPFNCTSCDGFADPFSHVSLVEGRTRISHNSNT